MAKKRPLRLIEDELEDDEFDVDEDELDEDDVEDEEQPEAADEQPEELMDFDRFFKEQKRTGKPFKLYGREYMLPATVPAAVVLRTIRLMRKYGETLDVPDFEMIEMGVDLFGKKVVDEWLEEGIDIEQLGDLIAWALRQYDVIRGAEAKIRSGKARRPRRRGR